MLLALAARHGLRRLRAARRRAHLAGSTSSARVRCSTPAIQTTRTRALPAQARRSSVAGSARSGSSPHTSTCAWTASSDRKNLFSCWDSSTSTSEVLMSNRTSKRLHKMFGAVVALGLSAAAAPSAASPTYPQAMADHLDPPCIPQCTVCHRDNVGGRKTVDKPFGLSIMELGLRFAAPQRIPELLDQMEAEGVDSDGDGAGDVVRAPCRARSQRRRRSVRHGHQVRLLQSRRRRPT